jgi:hypothetical protein
LSSCFDDENNAMGYHWLPTPRAQWFSKVCDAAALKIIQKRILTLTKSGYKQNMKVRNSKHPPIFLTS